MVELSEQTHATRYERDTLRESLHHALEMAVPETGYAPDRSRQREVLDNLPDDTLYELAGHLRSAYLEQQKFARLKRATFDEEDFDDETVLRGKVFEMLIAADPALHTPDPIAEELLTLMHDPERFRLEHMLKYYRTPDAAYLYVDRVDDVLVVRAAAEAKLGRLNDRAFRQLSERGFRYGLENMASCMNALDDPIVYGLIQIATFKQRHMRSDHPIIMVAPDFHQILVVPANRDLSDPASLVRASDFDDPSYGQMLYLLSDSSRLTMKKAAFSTAEVAALTSHLYTMIRNMELITSNATIRSCSSIISRSLS